MENLAKKYPMIEEIQKGREVVWINPAQIPFAEGRKSLELTEED